VPIEAQNAEHHESGAWQEDAQIMSALFPLASMCWALGAVFSSVGVRRVTSRCRSSRLYCPNQMMRLNVQNLVCFKSLRVE